MNSTLGIARRICYLSTVLVLLFMHSILPQSTSRAATYYIDGSNPVARDTNPGTETRPFKTVNKATPLLRPGDTLYIKAGIYRETILLTKSGTPTSPITIAAYPGHEGKVIINAAEPVMRWHKCTGPDEFTRYVHGLLDLPFMVGFHWFEHADEPKEGRFDGENSNYGLVTIEDQPWEVLTRRMTQVNAGLESRHAKQKARSAK